jgi:hypothetical protein
MADIEKEDYIKKSRSALQQSSNMCRWTKQWPAQSSAEVHKI